MTAYTLFSQGSVGTAITSDTGGYTMGVEFSVSQAGTLSAVWFYSNTGAVTLPTTIALYAVSGTSLVHSESASWSGAVASGWIRAAFTSAPSLTASTNYRACVLDELGGGNWYTGTNHYWDTTGAGSGGITNGPLSAPNSASSDVGQSSYNAGTSLTYPGSSFQATNYWVDPEVSVTAVTPPPVMYLMRSMP